MRSSDVFKIHHQQLQQTSQQSTLDLPTKIDLNKEEEEVDDLADLVSDCIGLDLDSFTEHKTKQTDEEEELTFEDKEEEVTDLRNTLRTGNNVALD